MTGTTQISQRDLRFRSREIMDAVERGESFVVTRGRRPMGQLIPLRRRFVSRAQFADSSLRAAEPDLDAFRTALDEAAETFLDDPYAR